MATQKDSLFGSETTVPQNLRSYPDEDGVLVGTLANLSGAPELPNLTPLSFDEVNSEWVVFDDPTNELFTITANATPNTGGTFTLSFGGETTSAIAFDADAAAVQAALEALSSVNVGDVSCAQTAGTDLGDASAVVTITFQGQYLGEEVALTIDDSGLTGGSGDHALANTQAGADEQSAQIDGLLWAPDEAVASSATDEVQIQVFVRGVVHHDDVPVPTTSSQTQGQVTAALKSQHVRKLGIQVRGVAGIH